MNNAKSKTVKRSAITLDSIGAGEFTKKGTLTAQVRQVITTVSMYAAKQTTTEMQGGLFSQAAFGAEFMDKPYESIENRVAWIPVPENTTAEQAAAARLMQAQIEQQLQTLRGTQASELQAQQAQQQQQLLAQKAEIDKQLLTAEGAQKESLLAQQGALDRQIQELRGTQTMGLQQLSGEQAAQLQKMRGEQAVLL